jgi:hypothetical protein
VTVVVWSSVGTCYDDAPLAFGYKMYWEFTRRCVEGGLEMARTTKKG